MRDSQKWFTVVLRSNVTPRLRAMCYQCAAEGDHAKVRFRVQNSRRVETAARLGEGFVSFPICGTCRWWRTMVRLLVLSAVALLVVYMIDHPKGEKVPTSLAQGIGLLVALVVYVAVLLKGIGSSAIDVLASNDGIHYSFRNRAVDHQFGVDNAPFRPDS
jgi:hypothetical protein